MRMCTVKFPSPLLLNPNAELLNDTLSEERHLEYVEFCLFVYGLSPARNFLDQWVKDNWVKNGLFVS